MWHVSRILADLKKEKHMAMYLRSTIYTAALAGSLLLSFAAISGQGSTGVSPNALSKLPLRLPLEPPTVPGCYTYMPGTATNPAAKEWQPVPCLSPEETKRVPHLLEGGASPGLPGIQSQVEPILVGNGRFTHLAGFSSAGLQAASISLKLVPGTALNEKDSATGQESFSIQLNTNGFNITCNSSNPLPPGAAFLSPCIPNDEGWVQFSYQTSNFGTSTDDVMCIWNVDLTQQYYYSPQTWHSCAHIQQAKGWPPGQMISLNAWVEPKSHLIFLTGTYPWFSGMWLVMTPDWFGLCSSSGAVADSCSWDEAVGGVLGYANGSTANFGPGTGIETTIAVQSPSGPFGGSSIIADDATGVSNAPGHWLAWTDEQNNLSLYYLQLPTTGCSGSICTFSAKSSNVPPP